MLLLSETTILKHSVGLELSQEISPMVSSLYEEVLTRTGEEGHSVSRNCLNRGIIERKLVGKRRKIVMLEDTKKGRSNR